MRSQRCGRAAGLLSLLLLASCTRASRRAGDAGPPPAAGASNRDRLRVGWDPKTGKGDVVHLYASGDLLRTCFHCGYPGYTGGLVVGGFNGSGMGFYPRRPIRGYRSINVFCAQDESIWDRSEQREYTYGWSENYGKGDDGVRLAYRRGRVVESSPARLILQSENQAGCYRVGKLAYTRAGVRWWIIATRVSNVCQHPVSFDLFSGDDPWIGLYRSAEGDVGWTPGGLVRRETALGAGLFVAGGLYDLGNQEAGEREGGFSNQANFIALDPALPLPDLALFASRFAHQASEIDPARPLDHKKMIALNLGWPARSLAPGQGLTMAFALGLAETGAPGTTPRAPPVTEEDWSVWRRYLPDDDRPAGEQVDFAAEWVELDVSPHELRVNATYFLRNRGSGSTTLLIHYPIITSTRQRAPAQIEVEGRREPVRPDGADRALASFPVPVPPRGLVRFQVRYRQLLLGRRAAYLVTSALSWPSPIARAVFVVRHATTLGKVTLSFPPGHSETAGSTTTHWVVRQPFVPDREVVVSW